MTVFIGDMVAHNRGSRFVRTGVVTKEMILPKRALELIFEVTILDDEGKAALTYVQTQHIYLISRKA